QALTSCPPYLQLAQILAFSIFRIEFGVLPFCIFSDNRILFIPPYGSNGAHMNEILRAGGQAGIYYIFCSFYIGLKEHLFVFLMKRNKASTMNYGTDAVKERFQIQNIENVSFNNLF